MSKGFFVTGTDTGVGKTTISLGLIAALQNSDYKVSAMKPIASGCATVNGELRNNDALRLIAACNQDLDYKDANPYAFKPPIAPHIAAEQAGVEINIATICKLAKKHKAKNDYTIIEGVGGWQVPLNKNETLQDLAKALNLPVILVVGLRLGCLNHALLTANAIHSSGLVLAGWVANHCRKNISNVDAIIDTLEQHIDSPNIGRVNYMREINAKIVANKLDVSKLD
ncbi:dethiobiotin synthase [Beggiatoa alba]|nr:dethiobiotin synthase [Beggiatoa alba]